MSPQVATRNTTLAAGAVLAALILVAVMVAVVVDGARRDDTSGTPARSSSSPDTVPRTLDDLPAGAPAEWPYLTRRTLVVDGERLRLDGRPTGAVATHSAVLVRFVDGSIVRVDRSTLRVDLLSRTSAGAPEVDPGGNVVVWQTDGEGRATVSIAGMHGRLSGELDRQTFPARPSCCDNPLVLNGMTQLGELYVSLPATWQVWRWETAEGQEGTPYEVPDSDDFVTEIRGLDGGYVSDVTANEVVVMRLPTTKRDRTVFGIGTVRRGSYRETERVRAQVADFRDPRARRVVYWTSDGRGHIARRTSGPGVQQGAERTVRPLRLPVSLDVGAVVWEGRDHVLLDVTEPSSKVRALVRCDARSGDCEMATVLEKRVLLARP